MIDAWTDEHRRQLRARRLRRRRGASSTRDTVERLRERFEPLFAGDWTTGIKPDEVNWVPGRDPEDRTRQICNGWKADPRSPRRRSPSERPARRASSTGWDGVRLVPGQLHLEAARREVARHAPGRELPRLPRPAGDDHVLDRARRHLAEAGTITYAAGSHRWPRSPENRGEFHAPADWLAPVAARACPTARSCGSCRSR